MKIEVNYNKNNDGLIPAIIQDINTMKVLMLGYMNKESLEITESTQKVTFFSRSKKRIWTKGEKSGNFLKLVSIKVDCDKDTLLIYAEPYGPTCHKGEDTCWGEENVSKFNFINELEKTIEERKSNPKKVSYISNLFNKGVNQIAQKVGEEAVETVIEAVSDRENLFMEEAADLFFHYLILLNSKGKSLKKIGDILEERKHK